MTSYRIEHQTTYTYDSDVTGSYGQFHLRPRDLDWQLCVAHEINVDPEPTDLFRHFDLYGNTKSYFHVVRPHTTLKITAISVVEVARQDLDPDALAVPWEQARPGQRPDQRTHGRRPTSPSSRRTWRSRPGSWSTPPDRSRRGGRSARRRRT